MKLKTHTGLKKRIKVKHGKLYFKKACKNHLLTGKSKRQKKLDKGGKPVSEQMFRQMKKLLPYS